MTGTDDEWPVTPTMSGPPNPTPRPKKPSTSRPTRPTIRPSSPRPRDWKHIIKAYSVFAVIATVVFGFVYTTDMFAGDEVGVIVVYVVTLASGLLYILIENENDDPDYHKKLREAKPRRALITDDQPPIIDMSTHHDRHDIDDDSWPVLQHKAPKPTFDVYDPDKQYWPHNPLPEKSTVYEKLRRLSWITGISMLWPLVLSVLIGFSYPDEPGLAEVQLMGAIACGFFFTIAYSEQLFIGGDH